MTKVTAPLTTADEILGWAYQTAMEGLSSAPQSNDLVAEYLADCVRARRALDAWRSDARNMDPEAAPAGKIDSLCALLSSEG